MKVTLKTTQLLNGETYGYREREGGDIPVLLIHGNMTSSKHWDLLIDELSEKYKVYAVDLRGFGKSSYHQKISGIKDFSEDVKLFVDAIGLTSFHLIGWSMGGAVAMQYTANHPDSVQSLILLASASTRGYPFYSIDQEGNFTKRLETIEEIAKDPIKTIPVIHAYQTKNKSFLRQLWEMSIYTQNKPDEELYDEYLDDMCTQKNIADVYQALNLFNISDEPNGIIEGTAEVHFITSPTLVLWGENDQVILKSMTDELIKDFGDQVEFSVLTGCGHSPLVDDIKQLDSKIETFIQQHM